jgi:hypothetical protein
MVVLLFLRNRDGKHVWLVVSRANCARYARQVDKAVANCALVESPLGWADKGHRFLVFQALCNISPGEELLWYRFVPMAAALNNNAGAVVVHEDEEDGETHFCVNCEAPTDLKQLLQVVRSVCSFATDEVPRFAAVFTGNIVAEEADMLEFFCREFFDHQSPGVLSWEPFLTCTPVKGGWTAYHQHIEECLFHLSQEENIVDTLSLSPWCPKKELPLSSCLNRSELIASTVSLNVKTIAYQIDCNACGCLTRFPLHLIVPAPSDSLSTDSSGEGAPEEGERTSALGFATVGVMGLRKNPTWSTPYPPEGCTHLLVFSDSVTSAIVNDFSWKRNVAAPFTVCGEGDDNDILQGAETISEIVGIVDSAIFSRSGRHLVINKDYSCHKIPTEGACAYVIRPGCAHCFLDSAKTGSRGIVQNWSWELLMDEEKQDESVKKRKKKKSLFATMFSCGRG